LSNLLKLFLNKKCKIVIWFYLKGYMIKFIKATASGNDFVIIDNRDYSIKEYSNFVVTACNRKFGIGADGVIFIENDADSDFLMKYFNADGFEGSFCGNGARCSAKFMSKILNKNFVKFKAVGKLYSADVCEKNVKLYLPDLQKDIKKYNFDFTDCNIKADFIDTGSPHIVIFEEDISNQKGFEYIDVYHLGRAIRYHQTLAPGGANINFVKKVNNNSIKVRTYERGVEDETLACGTGSIASAILFSSISSAKPPISVFTQGGEKFKVDFKLSIDEVSNLLLEGSAIMVFEGVF
jgi:diaminopimelate epimerase